MKKILLTLPLILIISFFLTDCTNNKKIKDPVFLSLTGFSDSIIKEENIIKFIFARNTIEEKVIFTGVDFSRAKIDFTPWRETGLDNSLSLFLHYQDKDNYYRINIFSSTGKAHFFKKEGKKIQTLYYDRLAGYNSLDRKKNIFTIKLNGNAVTCSVNDKIFCNENLDFSRGKIGFGAYGKQNNKAEFIFNFSK